MKKIAALVPMRHHSQRVPGKNYRPLAGKPLYHHIISTLFSAPEITEVVVDTDSRQIIDGLAQDFPKVVILPRPEHLCADTIPMNEILIYDISQVKADFYLQTHSTNPLLKPETISSAIQSLLKSYPTHDSLFSVTRLRTRLWDRNGCPLNHDPTVLLQTQDLPLIYEENSCLYIFTGENLQRRRNRIGEKPMMFEVGAEEAWDIDDELDFEITDFLMRRSVKK